MNKCSTTFSILQLKYNTYYEDESDLKEEEGGVRRK